MPDTRRLAYSREQVLFGMREVASDFVCAFVGRRAEIPAPEADAAIDEYFVGAGLGSDCGMEEFRSQCEEYFGIRLDRDAWEGLRGRDSGRRGARDAQPASHLTFGRLADLFAERMGTIWFTGSGANGAACVPAGAFRVVVDIARQVEPKVGRVRPSTPLDECLDL